MYTDSLPRRPSAEDDVLTDDGCHYAFWTVGGNPSPNIWALVTGLCYQFVPDLLYMFKLLKSILAIHAISHEQLRAYIPYAPN